MGTWVVINAGWYKTLATSLVSYIKVCEPEWAFDGFWDTICLMEEQGFDLALRQPAFSFIFEYDDQIETNPVLAERPLSLADQKALVVVIRQHIRTSKGMLLLTDIEIDQWRYDDRTRPVQIPNPLVSARDAELENDPHLISRLIAELERNAPWLLNLQKTMLNERQRLYGAYDVIVDGVIIEQELGFDFGWTYGEFFWFLSDQYPEISAPLINKLARRVVQRIADTYQDG